MQIWKSTNIMVFKSTGQIYGASFYAYIFRKIKKYNLKTNIKRYIKVGLSPSKKYFSCFNRSPLKLMKNAFYFVLKALFPLKIFKSLSGVFGQVEKTTWLKS